MSPAKKKTAVKKEVAGKTAAKQGVAKKTASKQAPADKATPETPAKKPTGKSKTGSKAKTGSVSAEQRWMMIAEAAYLKAEKRGFVSGHELEDWTAAEIEIDRLLAGK